jgi:hypothetical protein
LQLVEPHNHRVNAAEQAIQTFKDAFIAALAMTDTDFPLQLWDKLAPQVQDMLNLMHASRTDPTILTYEAINGPYNWGRYPLALPRCKAIMYKAPAIRGSWALCGTNAWCLGSSPDHYQYNVYYIPATQAYPISSLAELFPQHCQVPNLTPKQNFHALTKELATTAPAVTTTPKGCHLLKLFHH